MDKLELISYFDNAAPKWDALAPCELDKLRCLATLSVTPGARVLDVGCGTGVMTPFLLEREPSYLLGVDFSPAMIEQATQKFVGPTTEFLCQDIMDLNRPGEFDCAVLYDTFAQFENRGSLIRHMHRLLAGEGRLMICSCLSRHVINASYKAGSSVSIPLPAAKTLASTMSQYFEVDTVIDSPAFYAVSGIKKTV